MNFAENNMRELFLEIFKLSFRFRSSLVYELDCDNSTVGFYYCFFKLLEIDQMSNRVWFVLLAVLFYNFQYFWFLSIPINFVRNFIKNLRVLIKFEVGFCLIIRILFFDLYGLKSVHFNEIYIWVFELHTIEPLLRYKVAIVKENCSYFSILTKSMSTKFIQLDYFIHRIILNHWQLIRVQNS